MLDHMLRFYIDHDGDGTPFGHLGGEVDVGEIDVLRAAIAETARHAGSGDVVLDLAAVAFIDSAGIRTLLEAHGRFAAEGRRLVLRSPSPHVDRVIEILGLEDTFAIDAS